MPATNLGSARRVALGLLAAACVVLAASSAVAGAAAPPPAAGGDGAVAPRAAVANADAQGIALLLPQIADEFRFADPTHDVRRAARVRAMVAAVRGRVAALAAPLSARDPVATRRAEHALEELATALRVTSQPLLPWPFVRQVDTLQATAARALRPLLGPAVGPAHASDRISALLDRMRAASAAGRPQEAAFDLAAAYGAYSGAIAPRLQLRDAPLADGIASSFWEGSPGSPGLSRLLAAHAAPAALGHVTGSIADDLHSASQALGQVRVSRGSIIADAAILVFREGLEAVLILAAITASFIGAKRHLRRPVLIGGLLGLLATAVTWVIAQTIVHSLSSGGLALQAVTGLLAIGVLLLVTNWFFHRVYWSQWIARFNKRRKMLERIDRTGFISGQVLGLAILGLTSVYREGFETVLFLQSLQVSAGTSATLLGSGIGLAATMAVGTLTFVLQRKLPYKKMLIVTGALIALILAVMVGTTVHTMQGLGWVATTPTPFAVPQWTNLWLGMFATWEGIAAQLGALVFVIGSYVVAREIQVRRPLRRSAAQAAAPAAQRTAG